MGLGPFSPVMMGKSLAHIGIDDIQRGFARQLLLQVPEVGVGESVSVLHGVIVIRSKHLK